MTFYIRYSTEETYQYVLCLELFKLEKHDVAANFFDCVINFRVIKF